MRVIKEIFFRDYSAGIFIVSIILSTIAFIPLPYSNGGVVRNILIAVAATLLFTALDVMGFKHVLNGEEPAVKNDLIHAARTGYYRILQTTMQVMLYVLVVYITNLWVCIAVIIIWWSGGCDLLYYPIGKYRLMEEQSKWDWLWWTPAGFILWASAGWDKTKIELHTSGVIAQAIIGLVAASGIIYWSAK